MGKLLYSQLCRNVVWARESEGQCKCNHLPILSVDPWMQRERKWPANTCLLLPSPLQWCGYGVSTSVLLDALQSPATPWHCKAKCSKFAVGPSYFSSCSVIFSKSILFYILVYIVYLIFNSVYLLFVPI